MKQHTPMGMLVLLLVACHTEHTCESETREIDDETFASGVGVSPAHVLSEITGVHDFVANLGGDPGTLAVARGEGSAVLLESESVSVLRPGLVTNMMFTQCVDLLQVPVVYDLRTEDGRFAIEGAGMAEVDSILGA